jgi:hypothetical protein
MTVAANIGVYAATAIGLNIVVGLAGMLDLGYVAFLGIGAFVAANLYGAAWHTTRPWADASRRTTKENAYVSGFGGTRRLVVYDTLLERASFDEVRLAGAGSPQVTRRLCAALQDLKSVAPPDRQAPQSIDEILISGPGPGCSAGPATWNR